MEFKTAAGSVAITAALVTVIFISSTPQQFYCPLKDENPYLCYKVSGSRCYTNAENTKYITCIGGWYQQETTLNTTGVVIKDGRDWRNESGICVFGARKPIECDKL